MKSSRMLLACAAAVVILGFGGCAAVLSSLAGGSSNSLAAQDFSYQCDSQLGPDPSASATVTPPPLPTDEDDTAVTPSTNPYAPPSDVELSELPDRIRQCLSVLPSAPYQLPPLTTRSQSAEGRQAALLANTLVSRSISAAADGGTLDGPTRGAISGPGLVRYVLYQATGHALVLPKDLPAQFRYGQRVDPRAISPGDVIFTSVERGVPAAAAIAISATVAVSVPTENGAHLFLTTIPTAGNIIIKRLVPTKGPTS